MRIEQDCRAESRPSLGSSAGPASRAAADSRRWLESGSQLSLQVLVALLFAVLLTSIALSAPRANHDAAMYLEAGGLLLDGERPYVDFVDLNPPLIIYLSAIPVEAARLFGVDVARMFSLAVCLLSGWSAWSVHRSTSRLTDSSARVAGDLIAAGLIALTLFLWRTGDYGQREHLIVLLLAPYLVARAASEAGRFAWGGVGRGLAAGIAICLKPQYGAVLVSTEGFLAVVRRRLELLRSAEIAGAFAFSSLYALHFIALPEAVRQEFFVRWLPFVSSGYRVFETADALWTREITATAAICAAILALRFRWRTATANLAVCFALATLVSIGVYLLQRKGWFYHQIPLIAFRGMAGVCVLAAVAGALHRYTALGWATVALLGWGVAGFSGIGGSSPAPLLAREHHIPFRGFVQKYTHPGDHVLVLTTSVTPAFPVLLEEGRLPATRYLWFFPVPMFRGDGKAQVGDAERRFLAEVKEDLDRSPPALVIVPQRSGCQGCPPNFELARYFNQAGALDAVANYRRVGETAGFDILAPPALSASR